MHLKSTLKMAVLRDFRLQNPQLNAQLNAQLKRTVKMQVKTHS